MVPRHERASARDANGVAVCVQNVVELQFHQMVFQIFLARMIHGAVGLLIAELGQVDVGEVLGVPLQGDQRSLNVLAVLQQRIVAHEVMAEINDLAQAQLEGVHVLACLILSGAAVRNEERGIVGIGVLGAMACRNGIPHLFGNLCRIVHAELNRAAAGVAHHVCLEAQQADAVLVSDLDDALVDLACILGVAMDLICQAARHAETQHAHGVAANLPLAEVAKLQVVEILLTSLFDNLQRFRADELENETIVGDVRERGVVLLRHEPDVENGA